MASEKYQDPCNLSNIPENIVNKLFTAINYSGNPEVIGQGYFANIYRIGNRVLKITEDDDDARAASSVWQHPSKYLIKVHAVLDLGNSLYAIVEEEAEPLTDKEYENWCLFIEICEQTLRSRIILDSSWLNPMRINLLISAAFHEDVEIKEFIRKINYLLKWTEVLEAANVFKLADVRTKNIMKKNGTYVLIDFGVSKSNSYIPQLEEYSL